MPAADRRNRCCLIMLLTTLSFAASGSCAAAGPASFEKDIRPLLTTYCISCHDAEKKKGNLDLGAFADEKLVLRQPKAWRRVLKQLERRDMPPEDEKQPTDEERQRLLLWVKETLNRSVSDKPDPGPAVVRRLNRTQYDRTIRDLVGIDFDSREAVGMPQDGGEGFDNLANALNLSPALVEKYFAAADKILERVLGMPDGQPAAGSFNRQQAQQARDRLLFVKPGDNPREAARQIITRFARRAYRRPVSDAEAERLLRLYDLTAKRDDRFENGIRLMAKAVLASPHFLLRVERDRDGATAPYAVSDHELAARLSYFLWSTMPDVKLTQLADGKKLSDPIVLEEQTKRMLADPKARVLTDGFAVQWLQLRKLWDARPSQEFFPTFTNGLRGAMYAETVQFFDNLRTQDRSVLELLDADYTYVNEELARHYGIPDVKGGQMRRVELKPEYHRGGLLGMGSVLTMTSHTSRTSPTMRGKWVLDVLFGTPPPPPPPDAGVLKERKKGEEPKTFRQLMALHATQNACASCHKKMDPLGYALDRFDGIGKWRDDPSLDTTGQLPTGEKIDGPGELKQLVLKRQDAFVQNLAEQLLSYALGRELEPCDEPTVRNLAAAMKKNDYRLSTLVVEIVKSYPFRHRRNRTAETE